MSRKQINVIIGEDIWNTISEYKETTHSFFIEKALLEFDINHDINIIPTIKDNNKNFQRRISLSNKSLEKLDLLRINYGTSRSQIIRWVVSCYIENLSKNNDKNISYLENENKKLKEENFKLKLKLEQIMKILNN